MKIKITRPDGTVIEAEGTADECERIAGGGEPLRVADRPVYIPTPIWVDPTAVPNPGWAPWPYYVTPRFDITCGDTTGLTASTLTIGGES